MQTTIAETPLYGIPYRHMIIRPHTRWIIQWSFVAIFIIVAPYLIIKVLGYVIDINHWRLVKAGSIYLQFEPRDAEISINGKPYPKKGSFVNHDVYISGLAPDTYTITLSQEGLTPWQKKLEVTSGMVARATNIILWPEQFSPRASSSQVTSFSPTLRGFINKRGAALSIKNDTIKGTEVIVSQSDSPYVVTKEASHYYFIDIASPTSSISIDTMFSRLQKTLPSPTSTEPIRAILPHPFNQSKLIIAGKTSLFLLDPKKETLERIIQTEGLITYAIQGNELFVIDTHGSLTITHLMLHTTTQYPTHLSFAKRIAIHRGGSYLLIEDENRALFLFNRTTNSLTNLANDVAHFSFSPDGTRFIYITNNRTVTTYYLIDVEDAVFHPANTTTSFVLAPQSIISTFSWIPSTTHYFLIQRNNTLMLEEFDTRTPRNVATIAKNVRSFILDSQLYILYTNNTLSYGPLSQ